MSDSVITFLLCALMIYLVALFIAATYLYPLATVPAWMMFVALYHGID